MMAKKYRALGTDFVTLFLGQQAKKFTVHRKLLCDRSELFFKAFCGQGTSSVIRLPEHDAESFNALINWLYRDWLPAYTDDVSTLAPPEKQKKCLALLYGVFVLAENYFINDLMNKTMDQLQDFHCVVFVSMAASDIIGLYRQTYEGSKLRVYIAGRIFISFRASRVGLPPALDKRWIELMRRCPDLAVEYTKFQLEFGFQMYKMLEGGAEFDIKSRGKG